MEENEKLVKVMEESLKKNLPEIVGAVVEAKIKELEVKTVNDMEEVKAELKKITLSQKEVDKPTKDLMAKTAVVDGFKAMAKGQKFEDGVMASLKTMNETIAADGGDFVFDLFEKDVIRVVNTYDVVTLVKNFSIVKGDKVIFPKKAASVTAYYVAEGASFTESEMDSGNLPISILKVGTLTGVTEELLEDTMTIPDLYSLLVEDVAEQVAALKEDAILGGNGTTQPQGIVNAAGINSVVLGAGGRVSTITDAVLVDVMTKAKKKYKKNPSWIMSQYTYGKLMAIKTTDGYPLYPELRNFAAPSLMGRKVTISDSSKIVQDLVTDVVNAVSVLYGDYVYYYMLDRKGLTFEKGHLANDFRDGKVTFRSLLRFGWAPAITEAFTVIKNGTT